MYVVTNRKLNAKNKGLEVFGNRPNAKGPIELRLVKVEQTNDGWISEVLDDSLTRDEVSELRDEFNLPIKLNDGTKWYASFKVACETFRKARAEKKSVLFYTHGYNNDLEDILKTSFELEKRYGVIVVPFTWPANGGGVVTGTASYLSDKRDARASIDAMDQFVGKIQAMHELLVSGQRQKIIEDAATRHGGNWALRAEEVAERLLALCGVKLVLLCHSMGNYVMKKSILNSGSRLSSLVFDNVCLVAADTNAFDHAKWVEKLDVRNQVYIAINEKDFALGASRIKPGEQQKARLGHSVHGLEAKNVDYIDVTGAPGVGASHSYFIGKPTDDNPSLQEFFSQIFNGQPAHDVRGLLEYQPSINCHRLK